MTGLSLVVCSMTLARWLPGTITRVGLRSGNSGIWAKLWKKYPIWQCWRIFQRSPKSASRRGCLPKFNRFFIYPKNI